MKPRLLLLSVVALLTACGGGGSGSGSSRLVIGQCDDPNAVIEDWFGILKSEYLWTEQLPASISGSAYSSPSAMLEDMKSRVQIDDSGENDIFSFILPAEDWNAQQAGEAFGFGMRLVYNESSTFIRVESVFANSGAEIGGLRRGDKILAIDDYSAEQIISDPDTFDAAFGPDELNYTIQVEVEKPSGDLLTYALVKGNITTNSVMAATSLDTNVGKAGYLSFQTGFIEPSAVELDQAFDVLKAANPEHLILDLRYNGGGRLDIAERLGLYIAGSNVADKPFVNLIHNDNLADRNVNSTFGGDAGSALDGTLSVERLKANALNLDEVTIITSSRSCSASESIIAGLAGHIKVNLVGSATCGKPVGMYPTEMCGETMLAINFETINAIGYGRYFDGIQAGQDGFAGCVVNDASIVSDWGDLADPMLSAAVGFIEDGSCPVGSSVSAASIDNVEAEFRAGTNSSLYVVE